MSASDLRSKSVDELNEELVQLRKEQFNLRMQQATQELSQNHQHKRVRKDIARIKTILGEKQRASGDKA